MALGWKRDADNRLSALMDAAADQHALQSERSVAELFRQQGLNVNTRVNKAKWALMERRGMSEDEAHKAILRRAMEQRISKKEVAERIIRSGEAP